MERDIAYCIDYLDLTNEQIGEILRATEKLGNITVEYFCEEFIFECNTDEEIDRCILLSYWYQFALFPYQPKLCN